MNICQIKFFMRICQARIFLCQCFALPTSTKACTAIISEKVWFGHLHLISGPAVMPDYRQLRALRSPIISSESAHAPAKRAKDQSKDENHQKNGKNQQGKNRAQDHDQKMPDGAEHDPH